MSFLINPYAHQIVLPAATREYRALKSAANQNAATLTVSACDVGAAAVGRHVFALFGFVFAGSTITVPSTTIGGAVGKVHAFDEYEDSFNYKIYIALLSAQIDAGATADISINLSGSRNCELIRCITYKVMGLQSDVPVDTVAATDTGGDTHNHTIDTTEDGIVIGGMTAKTSDTNLAWAGLTEDVDSTFATSRQLTSASMEVGADAVGFPFSTISSGSTHISATVAGSFR